MHEKLALVGVSISVFTLATIFPRPRKPLSDTLLIIWLLLLVFGMLRAISADITIAGFSLWKIYNPIFNLLHGPLLYFYVRTLTQVQSTLVRSDLVHLAPFALFYLLSAFTDMSQQMAPGGQNIEAIILNSNSLIAAFETLLLHFAVLNVASFLVYSLVVVWLLFQHQHKIARYFSRNDPLISLTWVYSLPATFLVITLMNLLNESGSTPQSPIQPLTLHILSHCSFAILLCFFGVHQKPVFDAGFETTRDKVGEPPEPENDMLAVKESDSESFKTEPQSELYGSLIEPENVEALKKEVDQYMIKDRPFLNPDCSVYTLADALNLSRHTLSFVLNSGFNKNFYQFVNSYRLEEMRNRLSDTVNKETILDIGFACGFSSKSTYNTLFKKTYGCTPSQFRKQAQTR